MEKRPLIKHIGNKGRQHEEEEEDRVVIEEECTNGFVWLDYLSGICLQLLRLLSSAAAVSSQQPASKQVSTVQGKARQRRDKKASRRLKYNKAECGLTDWLVGRNKLSSIARVLVRWAVTSI